MAAALESMSATVELIADGVHIHPAVLRLVALTLPSRTVLVTDAIRACGMPPGRYRLYEHDVVVHEGEARLDDGTRPWLSYFYLAHGIGTDSAEMPFVGTDLGSEFDAAVTLQPGMVLVFEPVVWDDGRAGHRSEEIVAVTADGYIALSERAELNGVGGS